MMVFVCFLFTRVALPVVAEPRNWIVLKNTTNFYIKMGNFSEERFSIKLIELSLRKQPIKFPENRILE